MKKNTLALNIGEEALIEGFGIVRCIINNIASNVKEKTLTKGYGIIKRVINNLEPNKGCFNCCFRKGKLIGCNAVGIGLFPYCASEDRKDKHLNGIDNDIIYIKVAADIKPKNN